MIVRSIYIYLRRKKCILAKGSKVEKWTNPGKVRVGNCFEGFSVAGLPMAAGKQRLRMGIRLTLGRAKGQREPP